MELSQARDSLKNALNTVKADIREILQSGNFYCTEEIARELTAIDNGLEHLKLDNRLLLSDERSSSFRSSESQASVAGATQMLARAAAHLFDIKTKMGGNILYEKQENELRELHQWAMTTLHQIQQDMAPYAFDANTRIKQFGDQIGVTDRYTGYRSNLTRGSREPFKMDTYWMDKKSLTGFMNPVSRSHTSLGFSTREQTYNRPVFEQVSFGSIEPQNIGVLRNEIRYSNIRPPMSTTKGYRTIDSLYPRSTTIEVPGTRVGGAPNLSGKYYDLCALNSRNATYTGPQNREATMPSCSSVRNLSVPEQAGINTTFPGKTEYTTRYTLPDESKSYDFVINPTPNLQIYGRPLGAGRFYPPTTEYQCRFEWPDGEKICKLPWLRK